MWAVYQFGLFKQKTDNKNRFTAHLEIVLDLGDEVCYTNKYCMNQETADCKEPVRGHKLLYIPILRRRTVCPQRINFSH